MGDSKIEALGRIPLFVRCGHKELEFLAGRTDEVDVDAGRTLIGQGAPGDTYYVLLDGEANVEVDRQARPALRAGDFFGQVSMLDRGLPPQRWLHRLQSG